MFYICRTIVWIAMHIAFNVKYVGKENLPRHESAIYTSNHRSNADPPLVVMGIHGKCSFMAKEELFRNKLFGWLISALGAFPVSRGKGDMTIIDTAVERLKAGQNLMIFPEGTRSKDGKVHRGKTGAALIAARSGKKIVPVGISFGEKLRFRSKIVVKYGCPIDTSEFYIGDEDSNPRELVKLKNIYMAEIIKLVDGECSGTAVKSGEDEVNE